jgi:hypothetical protein
MLKPSSFFDVNPALDVPQVADMKSRVAFTGKIAKPVDTASNQAESMAGKACCA